MNSLSPADWDYLTNNIISDLDGPLSSRLIKYYYKSVTENKCDKNCKKKIACDLKQSKNSIFIAC